jgi:flagellar biosynthesis/type III secretory pathway chaperone
MVDILEQQYRELISLTSLLGRERELLVSSAPDGDALAETAVKKAHSLDSLKALEAQLATQQEALGMPSGIAGRREAAQIEGCQSILQRVLDTAAQVFRLNQLNGDLVNTRLSWNQRLLNFIREAQGNWMYTPSGKMGPRQSTTQSRV